MFIFPHVLAPQVPTCDGIPAVTERPADGVPPWMTKDSLHMLRNGYLLEGETPWDMYKRAANASAMRLGKPELADKFFSLMWYGWLGLATPVAGNMGTTRGLPISCNSLEPNDDLPSIYSKNAELGMLASKGAGVGIYVGNIRARGAAIGTDGSTSNGVVPWCKMYDQTTAATNQGNHRKGQSVFYLPTKHGDIKEFLRIRRPEGDDNLRCMNTHHAVCITDEEMRRLEAGDPEMKELFQEILRTRIETGEPYLFFTDNVNRVLPEGYERLGLKVKTSNLCLLGSELVLTDKGPRAIKDLVGKSVKIWDGKHWVANKAFQYKGDVTVLKEVTFEDGTSIRTTFNHRFPIVGEGFVEAMYLAVGMEVETHDKATNKASGVITKLETLYVKPTATYCTEVPTTHKFALANGLMTGNCSEITAYTDADHSFVCCLSSMNLAKWHEWKDTKAVYYATWFLEGVMLEYIAKAKDIPFFEAAVRFAEKSHMLGLGVLGYHTLLQQEGYPFESFQAQLLNKVIFKHLAVESNKASRDMAEEYGEPEWCIGTGVRNTQCLTVAPTVSNSLICGDVSAGIEPLPGVCFERKTAKGTLFYYNPIFRKVLQKYDQDHEDVWMSIVAKKGSVQHLDFLTPEEKELFLTAREINQLEIVRQAADRQKQMDLFRQGQSQSVNLYFPKDADETYVTRVHYLAWKLGLKTLYYCKSEEVSKADLPFRTQQAIDKTANGEAGECLACHG